MIDTVVDMDSRSIDIDSLAVSNMRWKGRILYFLDFSVYVGSYFSFLVVDYITRLSAKQSRCSLLVKLFLQT
jgi:hypothetical protein